MQVFSIIWYCRAIVDRSKTSIEELDGLLQLVLFCHGYHLFVTSSASMARDRQSPLAIPIWRD